MPISKTHGLAVLLVSLAGCNAFSGFDELTLCPVEGCGDASRDQCVSETNDATPPMDSDPDSFDSLGGDTATDVGPETIDAPSPDDTAFPDTAFDDTASPDTALPDTADSMPLDSFVFDTADGAPPLDSGVGCGGTAGPTMVDLGTYCIDSTEITNAQYALFRAAKGTDTSGQPSVCAWNASYASFTGAADDPVTGVDWCDAYAYCAWAGKRLCGARSGGTSAFSGYATSSISAWFTACSAGGSRTYPYGSTFVSSTCRGKDHVPSGIGAVGSATGCVGGFAGIYDMSGNAAEWEDSCSTSSGASDQCRLRGGSFDGNDNDLRCTVNLARDRSARDATIGFRCCSR